MREDLFIFATLFFIPVMKLPPIVISKLEQRSDINLTNPSDRDIKVLLDKIEDATHVRLGLNTMKRFLGRITDICHQSRPGTLNVVAQYLGSSNWLCLLAELKDGSSSFTKLEGELCVSDLTKGQIVEVTYEPDRRIQFKYLGKDQLEITFNECSQLCLGDVCTVRSILPHYPLIMQKVVRDGVVMGSYIGARQGGVSSVKVLK